MILRARIVLPITAPPIEDGAVFVAGEKIQWVQPWNDVKSHIRDKAHDLGEVILMPRMLN
jgi:imidazolonepropionase-like amidohydrolase